MKFTVVYQTDTEMIYTQFYKNASVPYVPQVGHRVYILEYVFDVTSMSYYPDIAKIVIGMVEVI